MDVGGTSANGASPYTLFAGTVNVVENTVATGPVVNDAVFVPAVKSLNAACVAVIVAGVPPVDDAIVTTRRFVGTLTLT